MDPRIILFLWLLTLGLPYTNELRLKLDIRDISGSKTTATIVCQSTKDLPLRNERGMPRILWQGSRFGISERDDLRSKVPGEVLVPDIRVNASDHYRCALLSSDSEIDRDSLRKRIHRELSASVPAEYGSCRPGYRLDKDRCYPCPPGSYTSGQDSRCFLCPKDFFSNIEAADSCTRCPSGTTTKAKGGADSENKCLDSNGHPVNKNTKWVVIGIGVLIFLMSVWVVIAIALVCWHKDDGKGNLAQRILKAEKGDRIHDTETEDSSEEHIYAEIGDPTYDTVAKDSDAEEHTYAEIDEVDEGGYEIPIKRKKDRNYTELTPNKDEHIYEEPPKDRKAKEKENRTRKQKKAANEPIYENIYRVSVSHDPTKKIPKYIRHGFQPVLTPSEESRP